MLNRFDEKYDIRLARYEEIDEVMDFIDTYWRRGHILAINRDFFEYEMVLDGVVNFVIAKSKETGKLEGIHGFLPCSMNKEKLDIWGVVWKTIPDAMPMLGMELKKRAVKITGARTEMGVGANPDTSVLLLSRIFHYYTAKMKHYYRLADRDDYKIAVVKNKIISHSKTKSQIHYQRLYTIKDFSVFYDFESAEDRIPFKDKWYYERRFYNHPIYTYELWGLSDGGSEAVIVIRRQEYRGENAIRIVDYLGDQGLFAKSLSFLDMLLKDAEYVDFYFDGFEEEFAVSAGMTAIKDNDINIIPDYFNPFEQKNIDIYVDASNRDVRCMFFKADGDQDRPG